MTQRTRQLKRQTVHQWAEALQRSAAVIDEMAILARRRERIRKVVLLALVVIGIGLLVVIPRLSPATLYVVALLADAVVVIAASLRLGGVIGGGK